MSGYYVPAWAFGYVDHRRRLFAPGACCSRCGVDDPVVLSFRSRRLLCRRCELFRRTGRTTEFHHLGGRPSPVVEEVDANLHQWLTLYQYGWRGRLEPGSLMAILADILTLAAMRLQEGFRGTAA